jgi:hypothetical protein
VSLYIADSRDYIHKGAIFRFSPFFWQENPLWIVRVASWLEPRQLSLHRDTELQDTFQGDYEKEDILAKAKKRYLIVISNDNETRNDGFHDVLVAPVYSIYDNELRNTLIERYTNDPSKFYLPHDNNFSELRESYVNLRKIRLQDKGCLSSDKKLPFSLNNIAMAALLKRYTDYISMDNPRDYVR